MAEYNPVILPLPNGEPEWSVGLLGARLFGHVTGDQITEARLQEIERRILSIEARLSEDKIGIAL